MGGAVVKSERVVDPVTNEHDHVIDLDSFSKFIERYEALKSSGVRIDGRVYLLDIFFCIYTF